MALNQGKALVIDDAEDWREELREVLEEKGFDVTTVADKPSALALLDKTKFDVTIIDVNLADEVHNIDGLLINRYIQENLASTRVLLISARSLNPRELSDCQPAVFVEKSAIWEQLANIFSQLNLRDNG